MKNMFAIMVAATALTIAGSAYSADESTKNKSSIDFKENGGYEAERTTQHTAPSGTTSSYKSNVDVDVDNKGNVTSTTNAKKTVDPKGLMNKTTTKTQTKVVNGRVVDKSVKAN